MNEKRIAGELMKIAKMLVASNNEVSALEETVNQFGFTLSDVSTKVSDFYFVIPFEEEADCKGLFTFFNKGPVGSMITDSNGVQYGPFTIRASSPRYGFCIKKTPMPR